MAHTEGRTEGRSDARSGPRPAGRGEGRPQNRRAPREEEWVPCTNLGRLVKAGKIKSLEEIFRSSIRIQEAEIVEHLLGKANLHEELLAIESVQKQSKAGQRTSMKVVAIVGNNNGYIGIGTHSSRELSTAIKGATRKAKINIIPVRLGQWDGVGGIRHTVSTRASGKCGSVTVRVVPAPMGTGIQVCDVQRLIFELAGVKDIFVKSFGSTKTTENLAKATIGALEAASNMFTPDQWEETEKILNPLVAYGDVLAQFEKAAIH